MRSRPYKAYATTTCGTGQRWNWCVGGCVPKASLMPDCQPPTQKDIDRCINLCKDYPAGYTLKSDGSCSCKGAIKQCTVCCDPAGNRVKLWDYARPDKNGNCPSGYKKDILMIEGARIQSCSKPRTDCSSRKEPPFGEPSFPGAGDDLPQNDWSNISPAVWIIGGVVLLIGAFMIGRAFR